MARNIWVVLYQTQKKKKKNSVVTWDESHYVTLKSSILFFSKIIIK